MTVYIAFIDFCKAFDSIIHETIWTSLQEQGVEEKYINIFKSIYNKSKAKIKLEKSGKQFSILRGVIQGDPLSPKLFKHSLICL